MTKRSLFFACFTFMLVFYSAIFFLDLDAAKEFISFITIITVIIIALSYGRVMGFLFGTAIALTNYMYFSPTDIQSIYTISGQSIVFPVICGVFFGFIGDSYYKKFHNYVEIKKQKETNEAFLEKKLSDYKKLCEQMTNEVLYRKGGNPPPFSDSTVERILGTYIDRFPPSSEIRTPAGRMLADKCFSLLSEMLPNTLAIMDLRGNLVAHSSTIAAFLGYFRPEKMNGSSIISLISEEHQEEAQKNISNVLIPGINRNEQYMIKRNCNWLIPGFCFDSIRITASGNPYSLVAILSNDKNTDDRFPSIDILLDKNTWMLSREGKTLYINDSMAKILGYPKEDISKYPISHFLDDQNIEIYNGITANSVSAPGTKHNIELITKSGSRIYTFMETFPAYSKDGNLAGLAVFIENITERKLVQKSLEHRLSVEKLITDISTSFIDIEPIYVLTQIITCLALIGSFFDARESHLAIFRSDRTGDEFSHTITGQSEANANDETISIPIMSGTQTTGFFRFVQESGLRIWLEEDINLLRLTGEIFVNAISRKHALDQLRISEEKMRITLHSIGDAVIATDTENQIMLINSEAEKLTGWNSSDALGKPLHTVLNLVKGNIPLTDGIVAEDDLDEPEYTMLAFDQNTPVLLSKNNVERIISIDGSTIRDSADRIHGNIFVFKDITERKRREEEIIYLSFHDKLTGLHNRAFFEVELQRLDTKRQLPLTLIIGDCNGLKITNDIFGHHEGDNLLKKIALIFKAVTRKEDIVARWGGDEFAIILPKTPARTAMEIRNRILEECRNAERSPIQPSISLGSATKIDESQDIVEILKESEDRMYRHKLLEDKSNRSDIIASLEKTLIEKSHETEEHAKRMQQFSERIALAIGLSDNEIDDLRLLSVLHDMGKIGIPDAILEKPSKLSDKEWEIMKMHPEKGFSIAESSKELSNIAKYILHHHERWDGSGYPHGLAGNSIPKLSRIISIVDAYDVITHARSYKKALSHKEAMEEIRRCAGSQFDPELVDVFEEIMKGYLADKQKNSLFDI